MRDVMNHIAMRLGWEELPRPHAWGSEAEVWRQDATTDLPLITTDNPIVFAAYAKAAMANRGWIVERGDRLRAGTATPIMYACDADGNVGGGFEFDPCDPCSEAIATLTAINEALCL